MPLLFQQSSAAWQKHAVHIEAQYRLWSADEVDALARSHLPAEVLRIYEGARYPVMRADIGRILILYVYGGLYADLDVLPNRERFAQCSLGIARMRARPPVQKWEWEMELLVATAGNPILMEWLRHIVHQVQERPYEKGFFKNARCRYIYQTTGPASMARFLKHPSRKQLREQLCFYEMNRPELAKDLSAWSKRSFDVITHFSMSYDTKEAQVLVDVSDKQVDLPPPQARSRKRLLSKCAGHCFVAEQALEESAPSQIQVECQKTEEELGVGKKTKGMEKEQSSFAAATCATRKEALKVIPNDQVFDSVPLAKVRPRWRHLSLVETSTPGESTDAAASSIGASEEMAMALSQRCEHAEAFNSAWVSHMVNHWHCVAYQTVMQDAPEIVQRQLRAAYAEHVRVKHLRVVAEHWRR